MASDTRYRDAGWLRWKYWMEGLAQGEIGDMCGVSGVTISRHMLKNGIPIRSQREVMMAAWARGAFDSEEYRRKKSEVMRAAWARGAWGSEETRRKMSEGVKAARARGDYDSEETRRKISEGVKAAHARGAYDDYFDSEEGRRKKRKITRAAWAKGIYDDAFDSEEYRHKKSESTKAAWARGAYAGVLDSEETRRKMSEGIRAAWARGAFDNAKPRAPFYPYKGTDYRSSWEVRMVQTFERLGWEFEYEPCRIPYVLDDGAHTYTPDFYVPHIDTYFDPHWDRFDDAPKFAAVREQSGINLVVMDEQQLKSFEAGGAQCLTN